MMLPTLNHRTNMDFTALTMLRLVMLHNYAAARGLRGVLHVENDQMLYGRVRTSPWRLDHVLGEERDNDVWRGATLRIEEEL